MIDPQEAFAAQVRQLNQAWWEHAMLEGDEAAIREELARVRCINPDAAWAFKSTVPGAVRED